MRVPDVAGELGLRAGGRNRWGPCPACAAERTSRNDRRAPLVLGHGGASWTCYACHQTGDAIDLVSYRLLGRRGREAGSDYRQVSAWLTERHLVVDEAPPPPPPPPRPASSMRDALRACARPADLEGVAGWLRSRTIRATGAPCGVLPASFSAPWWPAGWASRWPLVVPAWTAAGELGSLHGRNVPGFRSGADRKSTWAAGVGARGLVFADPLLARPWLRGGRPPAKVLVAEGITDYLAASSAQHPEIAVLGIEAGSAEAFGAMPWVDGQRLYLATDPDEAGERYAAAILRVLPRCVATYRIPIRKLMKVA